MPIKIIGRRLSLCWGNMTIVIEKRLDNPKNLSETFPCYLEEIRSIDGVDISTRLGTPADSSFGKSIDYYLTTDGCWMTEKEAEDRDQNATALALEAKLAQAQQKLNVALEKDRTDTLTIQQTIDALTILQETIEQQS